MAQKFHMLQNRALCIITFSSSENIPDQRFRVLQLEAFLKEFQDWIVDLFTPQLGIDYFGGRARRADAATFLK